MKQRLKSSLWMLILIPILLVGCGNEEKTEGQPKESKQPTTEKQKQSDQEKASSDDATEVDPEDIEVKPLPSTYSELENLPVGPDSEFIRMLTPEEKDNAAERFADLPDISGNPSKKELDYFYEKILERNQVDYVGPESLMKDLKFQALGDPDMEDSRYAFKENLNIEIVLDASGSMIQDAGGKSKMDIAKEEIKTFLKGLPEGTNVGLRVYGHKGSNEDSAKELSCKSTDILYPIDGFDSSRFDEALNKVKPTGWTPISLALQEAKKDLSAFNGEKNTNIVYLVSDGVETCDEDPVKAAKDLYESDLNPIINVIGFKVDGSGQRQLKDIADATEGIYSNVEDQKGLKSELDKVNDIAEAWDKWQEKGELTHDNKRTKNSLDIFGYGTREKTKALHERDQIRIIMSTLEDKGKMSTDSRIYLDEKNNEYHEWIRSEVDSFVKEMEDLNEKGYKEAQKALKEKYESNTQ